MMSDGPATYRSQVIAGPRDCRPSSSWSFPERRGLSRLQVQPLTPAGDRAMRDADDA
jgi:hypothetical protein